MRHVREARCGTGSSLSPPSWPPSSALSIFLRSSASVGSNALSMKIFSYPSPHSSFTLLQVAAFEQVGTCRVRKFKGAWGKMPLPLQGNPSPLPPLTPGGRKGGQKAKAPHVATICGDEESHVCLLFLVRDIRLPGHEWPSSRHPKPLPPRPTSSDKA
jgi:hypothetical protein